MVALSAVLLASALAQESDLFMFNRKSVSSWPGGETLVEGTWIIRTGEDRLTPGVVRVRCTRENQNWTGKPGPECQEISASLYPTGGGRFSPDLSLSYFSVQSWTESTITAMGTEGVCALAWVLNINLGAAEEVEGVPGAKTYPAAVITKTKVGPMVRDTPPCKAFADAFEPYTLILVGGSEAQQRGKLWWPLKD